jgi:hypothetical protein
VHKKQVAPFLVHQRRAAGALAQGKSVGQGRGHGSKEGLIYWHRWINLVAPRVDATPQVKQIFAAQPVLQVAQRLRRAHAMVANKHYRPRAADFGGAARYVAQRNKHAAGDAAVVKFHFLAHINELNILAGCEASVEGGGRNVW